MMLADVKISNSGSILYNGRAVTGPGTERALIFQQPLLYAWLSVFDSAAFGVMLQGIGR
jgi:ABC-type taurine transport system ATPase subunit